jgi:hypothetical protein
MYSLLEETARFRISPVTTENSLPASPAWAASMAARLTEKAVTIAGVAVRFTGTAVLGTEMAEGL